MFALQRRAWRVLTVPLRWKVALVFVCTLLISALEVLGISLIFPILGLLVEPQLVQEKQWLAYIYSHSGASSPDSFVRILFFTMAGAIIVKNIGAIMLNQWQISFLQSAAANVSKTMFKTYIRMPFSCMDTRDTGFFVYVVNSLGGIFYNAIIQQSLIILGEVLTVLLLTIALILANPLVTIVAVGILTLSGGLIYVVTAKKLRAIGVVQRAASERSVRLIKETFSAFKEIRVCGRGEYFEKAYAQNMDDLAGSQISQMRTVMLTRHMIEIVVALVIIAVAGLMLKTGTLGMSIGQLSLFGVATLRIMPSISRIISALQALKTTEAPMDLYEDELAEMATWPLETLDVMPPPIADETCECVDVQVRNINFSYGPDTDHVLRGVSLDIPFGVVLGIAGPSGAGKTTLADIILGVIEPSQGQILYNGQEFSRNPTLWRQKIAYVPQRIPFVSGSLRENVAFGIMADDIDDARVMACLEHSQLAHKLNQLSDGLNSSLGEDGKFLSGGEKQRLGIARALYQNASILVLDEATSALDAETEDKLSQVILGLRGSRTVLIIAHRLATLQNCDRIAFMEDGRLELGDSFTKLYQSNRRFSNMVELSRIDPAHHLD